MEKDRGARVIALAALLVGVVGLSIGFSAFSSKLTIQPSAEVTPDESTFDVNFSTVATTETEGDVVGVPSADVVTATTATIDNTDDPIIENLGATFTEPGQSVTYSFFAHNNGKYKAFLNEIKYNAVDGSTLTKVCEPADGTDADMVEAACNAISVSVKVGSDAAVSATNSSIDDHTLDIDGFEPVVVTISYAEDGTLADGDFSVKFGDIVLNYDSVEK